MGLFDVKPDLKPPRVLAPIGRLTCRSLNKAEAFAEGFVTRAFAGEFSEIVAILRCKNEILAQTGKYLALLQHPHARFVSEIVPTYNILLQKRVIRHYVANNTVEKRMAEDKTAYESKEWLSRKECSGYLLCFGLRLSVARLANLASNRNAGGGPPFFRTRWSRVSYKTMEVAEWAKRQTERIS